MTKKFVVVPQNSVVNIKVKVKGVTGRHLLSAPASENNERVRIIYSEGERPIPRNLIRSGAQMSTEPSQLDRTDLPGAC